MDFFCRIEWEAYDDHSGLDSVYWKIYDNYGNYIEHGHEDIVAQGHAAVSFIYKPYIYRERDRMVVGFTTCAISAYSH